MSPEEQALAAVVLLLDQQAIPYMVTGSVASSYYGRPRSTHDADIVIDPTPAQLDAFIAGVIDAGFYADADGAQNALRRRTQFNVIETRLACKFDIIIRRDRPFSIEEFARRRSADLRFLPGVSIVSAEDAILSKLEWAKRSGASERQLSDVAGILELTPSLDREYLDRWATTLGVEDLWLRVSSEPGH